MAELGLIKPYAWGYTPKPQARIELALMVYGTIVLPLYDCGMLADLKSDLTYSSMSDRSAPYRVKGL